jgi:hypothetical protein
MPSPAPTLPERELDDYKQFGARINASKRTVIRLVEGGMPIIRIGRLRRIDPLVGMAWIRGERPAPEPVRRGRPKKDSSTASAAAATDVARWPKMQLHNRTRRSL